MNLEVPQLAPDEREQARILWSELLAALDTQQYETARYNFKNASPRVQSAIFYHIELAWEQGSVLDEIANPFGQGT